MLFVTGMETKLEALLANPTDAHLENIMMIQCYGPVISHPFGEVMRDIIITVYEKKIEEIIVVASKEDHRKINCMLNQLVEAEGVKEKIQTLDYLSKNCMPEFPVRSVRDWLEGREAVSDMVQNTVNIIRQHPLLPPHVKVKGLTINEVKKLRNH